MKFNIGWQINEAYAYCLDYLNQLNNWLMGTYCLYFSESFYVDRVPSNLTGIDNVTLWIGPNTRQKFKRIFIANKPNEKHPENLVMMRIPEYKITGKINKEFLTPEKMEQIKNWIIQNEKLVFDYCDFNTYDSSAFFKNIKPVNNRSSP